MKAIRYHTPEGVRSGVLVHEGRRRLGLVLMDYPVRLRYVDVAERRYITELADVDVERWKAELRRAARAWPQELSKECRRALRRSPTGGRRR